MSRCISTHGEYSTHELDLDNRCQLCRVWQCPKCGEDEPYPLIRCSSCSSRLAESRPGVLVHHDDGSHTFKPADNDGGNE